MVGLSLAVAWVGIVWQEHQLALQQHRSNVIRLQDWPLRIVAHVCGYPLSRYTCRATRWVFLEWGHQNQHRTGHVGPSRVNMISHIFPCFLEPAFSLFENARSSLKWSFSLQKMQAHLWNDLSDVKFMQGPHAAAKPPYWKHPSYTCSRFPQSFGFFQMQQQYRATPPPPQKTLSYLSPFNCQGCRTSSCLWKGVALQGGVAATLAGVALHCVKLCVALRQWKKGSLQEGSSHAKTRPKNLSTSGPKKPWQTETWLENGPTCYRAPKWPDPEFPRKMPKKYPPARHSGLPEFTPKIPRKYQKIPPEYQKCAFLVLFFRYFLGIFLGFQNFGPRGIFLVFFMEIPERAISGLCSRSGRS